MEKRRQGDGGGKQRRSRRGCLTCRSRKVRCDETPGKCQNCHRLNAECRWAASSNSQRSRSDRACHSCRQRKTRCLQSESSSGVCDPCKQGGFLCSIAPPPVSVTGRSADLIELLNAFFEGPQKFFFFNFVHKPSFMQMLDKDLVQRHLLLIMCASVCRIRDPSGPADAWAEESRHLVMQQVFTKLSTGSLQTLLLLQRYEENQGAHLKVWLLSGLAIRVAHALQLNVEHENQPIVIREVRRRIMWSCLVMHSLMESGVKPVSGLRVNEIDIRLPCSEASFLRGEDEPGFKIDHTDYARSSSAFQNSIDAQLVALALLRLQVVEYTFAYHKRNMDNLPPERPWSKTARFSTLQERLDEWERQLPDHFRLGTVSQTNPENIQILNLHCLFHGAYCDLLRIGALLSSLPASSYPVTPPSFASDCARGLLGHALALAKGISTVAGLLDTCDTYAAICGCLALRLLIVDRRPAEYNFVSLTDSTVRGAIDGTFQGIKDVSRWSEPIRRFLSAVVQMSQKCGYSLPVDEVASAQVKTAEASRAPSPSLRTYGTFGSVQRELAASEEDMVATASVKQPNEARPLELPSLAAIEAEQQATSSSTYHGFSDVYSYAGVGHTDALSDEALQTFTGWTDGTYDLISTGAFWNDDIFSADPNSTDAFYTMTGF